MTYNNIDSAAVEIDISMCDLVVCYCCTVGGNVIWNHNENIACNWFAIFMLNKWRLITTTQTDIHVYLKCMLESQILEQRCVQRLKLCIEPKASIFLNNFFLLLFTLRSS